MKRFSKPKRKSFARAAWGIGASIFFALWAILIPHPITFILVIVAAGAGVLAILEGRNGKGEWFEISETSITFGRGNKTEKEIRTDNIAEVMEEDIQDSISISFIDRSGARIASYDIQRWFSTDEIMQGFLYFLTDHHLELKPLRGRSSRSYQLLSRSALQER